METNKKQRVAWYIGAIIAVLTALVTYLTSCTSILKVSQSALSNDDTVKIVTTIKSTTYEKD